MVESALAMMEFLRPLFIVTAVALVVIVVVMLIIIAPRFRERDPSEIDQMHFLCGGSYFWNLLSYKSVHYDVHVR